MTALRIRILVGVGALAVLLLVAYLALGLRSGSTADAGSTVVMFEASPLHAVASLLHAARAVRTLRTDVGDVGVIA